MTTDRGDIVAITGALSYTGKYTAHRLLRRRYLLRSLTFHINRNNPFGDQLRLFPYNFDNPEKLEGSLRGASTLVNTYWVRFPHKGSTFETAVENTRTLINAALRANVERIVHVSIANPSATSSLGYYRGKAEVEDIVRDSGLSYAILRPTVIFGLEDILVNNIAWFSRKFPVFAIPGDGQYRVRPIYVGDMAGLIEAAVIGKENYTLDAVGPEILTFQEMVR